MSDEKKIENVEKINCDMAEIINEVKRIKNVKKKLMDQINELVEEADDI